MEQKSSQLRQREELEQTAAVHAAQGGHEFASPEDMLRFDANQTTVPPGIGERLQKSIDAEPKERTAWWRRWFSRTPSVSQS